MSLLESFNDGTGGAYNNSSRDLGKVSRSSSGSTNKRDYSTSSDKKNNISFKLTKNKSRKSATIDLKTNRDYSILNNNNNSHVSRHVMASNFAASTLSSVPTSHAMPSAILLPGMNLKLKKSSGNKKKKKSLIQKGLSMTKESKVDEILFSSSLEEAIQRDPSHDGIPLPSFLRYCFDFVDRYGLCLEGIYRVSGVKSQIQAIVNYLNKGIAFPNLPPTSAKFLNKQFSHNHQKPSKNSNNGHEVGRLYDNNKDTRLSIPGNCENIPPHDPYVIACIIKMFLRSLSKDSFLSKSLKDECEAACDLTNHQEAREKIGLLIHSTLRRPQRYLLAWILQNLVRVVNFSGNNLMNLQNLVTVMAPCLGISHRLLEILLTSDSHDQNKFIITTGWDKESEESSYEKWVSHDPTISTIKVPHWLFPDKAFRYRPYIPPLLPMNLISDNNEKLVLKTLSADLFIEQVEDPLELDRELKKQISLLTWIQSTLANEGHIDKFKDNFLWEIQRIVTQMKRKKTLLDLTEPDLIKNEINRIQSQLDKLHQEVTNDQQEESVQQSATSKAAITSEQIQKSQETESEIWCLQRTVTLLKRRLKYHEKLNELARDAENKIFTCQDPHKSLSSLGNQILNPTPLENIDEEEVLNLTLRKLTIEQRESKLIEKASHNLRSSLGLTTVPLCPSKVSNLAQSSYKQSIDSIEEESSSQVLMDNELQTPLEATITPVRLNEKEVSPRVDLPIVPPRPMKQQEVISPSQTALETPEPSKLVERPITLSLMSAFKPPTTQTLSKVVDVENQKLIQLEYRHLELSTTNADLKQRVRSEREEIARIKMVIEEMLHNGQDRARRYYANHLAMGKLLRQSSCLKSLDRLTNLDPISSTGLIDETEIQDWEQSHESIVNPYSKLVNEFNEGDQQTDSSLLTTMVSSSGEHNKRDSSDDESLVIIETNNKDDIEMIMTDSDQSSDHVHDEDEEDEDDDEASCSSQLDEYELAAQLYQLVKDNNELENLNGVYLKKIQELRTKCSELKVNVKICNRQ